MFFDESDEVRRGVACEGGFREVRVGTEEILRPAMNVGEVATPATGDENFLADLIGPFENRYTAAALAGFDRAEEPGSAGAEHESIKFVY